MLLSQALIRMTCKLWHQHSSEGTGVLGEKVEAVLAADGSCLHLADASTARALSSGGSCSFNQAISSSLLSNFRFRSGSGQTERKRGVSIHAHTHTNKHKHKTNKKPHTVMHLYSYIPNSHPPVFTDYRVLPGYNPSGSSWPDTVSHAHGV